MLVDYYHLSRQYIMIWNFNFNSLLMFIRENDCFVQIDGRVCRNSEVFNRLAIKTNERHQTTKTGEQWRTKWKNLKRDYNKEKNKSSKSGAQASTWRFYDRMEDTMGHRPCANNVDEELAQEENNIINSQRDDESTVAHRPDSSASNTTDSSSDDRPPSSTTRPQSATTSSVTTKSKRKHSSGGASSDEPSMKEIMRQIEQQNSAQLSQIHSSLLEQQKAMFGSMATMFQNLVHSMNGQQNSPYQPPPSPYLNHMSMPSTPQQPPTPGHYAVPIPTTPQPHNQFQQMRPQSNIPRPVFTTLEAPSTPRQPTQPTTTQRTLGANQWNGIRRAFNVPDHQPDDDLC